MKGRVVAGVAGAAIAIATAVIARWEGTRYVAYQDVGGVWTICHGHTRGVKPGDTATKAQCDAYLRDDVLIASDTVDRCIHVPLNAHQRAAFTSATFNLGPAVVCGSTLQRKANAGDIAGACAELTDAKNSKGEKHGWTYGAGKRLRGLILRRQAERELCMKPDFSNVIGGVLQ